MCLLLLNKLISIHFKWSVLILTLVNADGWVHVCAHTDSLGSQCLPELENRCLRYYFKSFFKFLFYVHDLSVLLYVWAPHACLVPTEARVGVGPLGIVVLVCCES